MMKQLLLILLAVLSVNISAQIGRFPFYTAASGAVYTDDFESYSTSSLAGQGNWVSVTGTLKVNDVSGDNIINPATSSSRGGCYYNQTFEDDQYSQIVIDGLGSTNTIGVLVRANGSSETCYYWYGNTSGSYLRRLNSGSQTDLDITSNTAWAVDDVIKLEADGDELKCYINGVLDTSIDGDGIYDDSGSGSKLSSGYAGIMGFGNSTNPDADDWEGGNL